MPKTREQKVQLVAKYADLVKDAKMVVVVNYGGVTVPQVEAIRNRFFEHEESLVIVKNNLLRLALKQAGIELPEDLYGQPLALAVNKDDEVLVCKDLAELGKNIEQMEVVAGIYDGELVGVDKVKQLSSLPSREELLAKVVGTIHAPITGFVNVVRGPLSGLINVLNQISIKKV